LRRVHRTFSEKLLYAAMYECGLCHNRKPDPRWYALYLGDYPRCRRCGTFRLTRLTTPDKIDRMQKGPLNYLQYLWGADLYHCRYCRVQFYDVRKPIAPEVRAKPAAAPVVVASNAPQGSEAK
jgi:hypothetical protein